VARGIRLVPTPGFPVVYKAEAEKGAAFPDLLRQEKDLNWTFIPPSARFVGGERTGRFRLGTCRVSTGLPRFCLCTPSGAAFLGRRLILSVTIRRYIRRARTDDFPFRLAREDGPPLEKLKNYRPTEKEPFMNDRQRDYFRAKLLAWKDEILRESKITLQTLQEENVNHPDLADRASSETDRAIELRARDRQRKLISKIDAALQRIEDNTYGYCEETGEPISLKRLEARPIATLSVEAQERHEKREKVYRDE
jgi:DnaK suppressor protein